MSLPFELESLSKAVNYQRWMLEAVYPYLGNRILEVGAGIGNMSRWLPLREKLIITEADQTLLPVLKKNTTDFFQNNQSVLVKEINLSKDWATELSSEVIDTIVSFNVLEHIEDDEEVIRQFKRILMSNKIKGIKRIVTLVPAHQWAYGEIDRLAGHFRRYTEQDFIRLQKKSASDFSLKTFYFNVFGLPSWWFMGRVLRKKTIGESAVGAFEKLCPKIKSIDNFVHQKLNLPFGQSIIGVLTLN